MAKKLQLGKERQMAEKTGRFIAFEGIDGSGKSTQIKLLAEKLKEQKLAHYITMEPTDSPIGCLIQQILTGRVKTDNKVVAALFAADRLDHLLNDVNGIKEKVDAGTVVLTDRYYFSSYAYQCVDMPMEQVIALNQQSSEIMRPDLNIFIDIDAGTAMERIMKNRYQVELFEKKSRLERTREGYREAFERMKGIEKIVVIDGTRTVEEVAFKVWEAVQPLL